MPGPETKMAPGPRQPAPGRQSAGPDMYANSPETSMQKRASIRAGAAGVTVAILNDLHISGAGEQACLPEHVKREHPVHVRLAVEQILALPHPPAAVVLNGDLAWWAGTQADYLNLAELLTPLRVAGLPTYMSL